MFTNRSRQRSGVCRVILLATIMAFQAKAQMSAPLVGLMAGESPDLAEIRPVVGVMGAASVQAAVPLPRGVSSLHLAPLGGWALVLQGGRTAGSVPVRGNEPRGLVARPDSRSGRLGLVRFKGNAPGDVQEIADAAANPSLVSFSPLGRAAALLASSRTIQVLTGLDATPRVAFKVEFFDASGLTKIAVSDDGQLLSVLTGAGQVYLLSRSTAPMFAFAGSPSLGMSFLPNLAAVVMADGTNGAVNLVRMVGGAPAVQAVTANLSVVNGATLVAASSDGAAAYVVISGSMSACRVELATGAIRSISLPVVATRLERLRDGESFVFSAQRGHAAWFLTGSDAGLQAVFASDATTTEAPRQ